MTPLDGPSHAAAADSPQGVSPVRAALFGPYHEGRTGIGLTSLRVLSGLAMAVHGWPKIQNPLHWMDKAASPPAAVLQLWAAVAEFGGGIALALGLLTPIACFAIATTMGYAIYHHVVKQHGWIDPGKGSYEAALGYLVTCLTFGLAGPGHLSVDAWLFRDARR